MKLKLNPCGKCWHVSYDHTFSEWYCQKWNTYLGYSLHPYKSIKCDIIGPYGDIKEIRAMFDWLEGVM